VDQLMERAGAPVWDAVAFDRLVSSVRNDLYDTIVEVARRSIEALALLRSIEFEVTRLDSPVFEPAVADIVEQVRRLIYPGFVGALGGRRLADVSRYLAAIGRRIERLRQDPRRDESIMRRVRPLEARHDAMLDRYPHTVPLLDIGWMLQELRVSLFAQSLGARGPVSEKRIEAAMHRVAMGE
jgi:ATP-dependent helicase HrpA